MEDRERYEAGNSLYTSWKTGKKRDTEKLSIRVKELIQENRKLREALVAMCEWWDQDDGLLSEFDSQRLFKARELAEKALGGK